MPEITKFYAKDIILPTLERTGYVFKGWFKSLSDDTPVTWLTMPDLTPLEQSNGSIMLYAQWKLLTYTVEYYPNGGAGTMPSSTHTYDSPQRLNLNLFYKTGHDFIGWAKTSDGKVVYGDAVMVLNLTKEAFGKVKLYAVWQPKTYKLIFKNLAVGMWADTDEYIYGWGLPVMPKIHKFESSELEYMTDEFHGWYTDASFTTKVNSISETSIGDITLYAKYDYRVSGSYSNGTYTVTDDGIDKQPKFTVDLMMWYFYDHVKDTTLSKIKITFSMNIWEVNDGYQDLYLYNGNTKMWSKTIEHGPGEKNTTPKNYTFTIEYDIEKYKDVDWLYLRFGAHGNYDDDWKFNDFKMEVYYTN